MKLSNNYIAKFGFIDSANRVADTIGDTWLGIKPFYDNAVKHSKAYKPASLRRANYPQYVDRVNAKGIPKFYYDDEWRKLADVINETIDPYYDARRTYKSMRADASSPILGVAKNRLIGYGTLGLGTAGIAGAGYMGYKALNKPNAPEE